MTLAGQRDDCLCCCCLVESSGWASIRVLVYQRHDVRKCDEIINSRRNELLVFIRIIFNTYINTSSTAVPMHEMMTILGWKRDTSLSEYLWHSDCSAIRLITPARSNMLCTVSTVEERQACPVTEFGFCIGCLLYTSPSPRDQRGSRMPSSA